MLGGATMLSFTCGIFVGTIGTVVVCCCLANKKDGEDKE